jgi:hypothetical protein
MMVIGLHERLSGHASRVRVLAGSTHVNRRGPRLVHSPEVLVAAR